MPPPLLPALVLSVSPEGSCSGGLAGKSVGPLGPSRSPCPRRHEEPPWPHGGQRGLIHLGLVQLARI